MINMINELKEIKKIKEKELSSFSSPLELKLGPSKNIINKLDQDILQKINFKIMHIESENSRLKDDLLMMQRSLEAMSSKGKGDSELIKKLEEEIYFLRSKSSNNEKTFSRYEKERNEIIQNYHEKIDQLNKVIKNLEDKLNNSGGNSIKFLEKENTYKTALVKIDEKNKLLENELKKLKEDYKEFELRVKSLQQDLLANNEKQGKEINKLSKSLVEATLQLEENKLNIIEKDKSINTLKEKVSEIVKQNESFANSKSYNDKNFEELKQKLQGLQNENFDIKKNLQETSKEYEIVLIKQTEASSENTKLKSELERIKTELTDMINNDKKSLIEELTAHNSKLIASNSVLSSEIDLMKKENKTLICKLESSANNENNEKINQEKARSLLFNVLKENVLNIENTNKKLIENNFEPIEKKVILLQNKFNNLSDFILTKIAYLNKIGKNKANMLTKEIKHKENYFNELLKSVNKENSDLTIKYEDLLKSNKQLETELEKNRLLVLEESKRYNLIKEQLEKKQLKVKALKSQKEALDNENQGNLKLIKDLENEKMKIQKKTDDPKSNIELKSCIQQIMSSNFKLALSLDSLYYLSLCKGCSEDRNPQFIRSCGHTLCEDCWKNKKECVECKETNSFSNKIENYAFSNIISKIIFINQVKNDINGIIDFIKIKLS